jgi:hypothetical protein
VPLRPFDDKINDDVIKRAFFIVDGNTVKGDVSVIEKCYRAIIIFRENVDIPQSLEKYLGKTTFVERTATQLREVERYYYAQECWADDYYFAEEPKDRNVIKYAFEGEILKKGKILYEAAEVDWSLFNEAPESAKCGAVCLYESLVKPSGAAFIELRPNNILQLFATTIDVIPDSPKNIGLWKMLMYGVQFKEKKQTEQNTEKKEHNLLLDGPTK